MTGQPRDGASCLGRHQAGVGHILFCWFMLCQMLCFSPSYGILVSDLVSVT